MTLLDGKSMYMWFAIAGVTPVLKEPLMYECKKSYRILEAGRRGARAPGAAYSLFAPHPGCRLCTLGLLSGLGVERARREAAAARMLATGESSSDGLSPVPTVHVAPRELDPATLDARLQWWWDPESMAHRRVARLSEVDVDACFGIAGCAAACAAVVVARPPTAVRDDGGAHLLRVGYCDGRRKWLLEPDWVDGIDLRYMAEPPSLTWVTFPVVASLGVRADVFQFDLALHAAFMRAHLSAWALPSVYVEHEVARFCQYHAAGGARRAEVSVVVLSEFYDHDVEDTHVGVVVVDVTSASE